jgi:hypothetical protein
MQTLTREIRNVVNTPPRFSSEDWWVEISTATPACVYYFGPFQNFQEASDASPNYILDLIEEGAQDICTQIKRCQPEELTQCYDEDPLRGGARLLGRVF